MSESAIWWLMAGTAVALELVSGTFYLLMIALGLAAGAVVAHLGGSAVAQTVTAALVGGGAVVAWHLLKARQKPAMRASANSDVNMDIGQAVQVDAWTEERSAQVQYRGAQWTAQLEAHAPARSGAHRIVEMIGSRLIVRPE